MKWLISGSAFLLLATFSLVFQNNYHIHQEQIHHLKYIAQEAAAGAAQYNQKQEYGNGYLVFNQIEGEKAVRHLLRKMLDLNVDMSPSEKTYWRKTEKIEYEIKYFDEKNYTFPHEFVYENENGKTKLLMTGPSVIVKVKVGKAKYDWLTHEKDYYRIGMYTFKE